jgi:hypothetical protein
LMKRPSFWDTAILVRVGGSDSPGFKYMGFRR